MFAFVAWFYGVSTINTDYYTANVIEHINRRYVHRKMLQTKQTGAKFKGTM